MPKDYSQIIKAAQTASENKKRTENQVKPPAKNKQKPAPREKPVITLPQVGKTKLPPMGLFIFLLVLGAGDIFLKRLIGYEPKASLLISIILGVLFFFAVKHNPFYRSFVIGAFAIDVVVSQGFLYLLPSTSLRNILIAIKVFIWLALAILLFLMEIINHLAEGEKVSKFSDIVALIIIGVLIFFFFPQLSDVYDIQDQSHQQYFKIAKEQIRKGTKTLSETKGYWSAYLSCTFKSTSDLTFDVNKCIKSKQETAQIKHTCGEVQKLKSGTVAYDDCVTREKGKKKRVVKISGSSDPTIKQPTTIDVKIQAQEKTIFIRKGERNHLNFPAELKIKNPQKRKLVSKVSCSFKKNDKIIKGKITPTDAAQGTGSFRSLAKEEIEKNIVCSPPNTIKAGRYELTFTTQIENLQSRSRLTRAFIGDKSGEDKKKLISKLKGQYRDLTKGSRSAKDPVRIVFALGEPPSDPIIEKDDNLLLRLDIQKNVLGKIKKIKNPVVDLKPLPSCLKIKDANRLLPTGKQSIKVIPLESCFISSLPVELNNPQNFVIKEFEASIIYNYEIEKKTNIKIEFIDDIK
tara:strand:+ start:347 stop:2068 length:1722 start_codon:yes stop_codon:yes gene_type:complete